MTKKQREEFLGVFAQAFHEVVVPVLEEMKDEMTATKEDVGRIERKLDNITDSHARKLDNHEHRIEKLEKRPQPLAY